MKKTIDLRSDTVTQPSFEMRQAIANAQLGDDVFQEDPTVNKLEKKAASIMGMDAALLVPSGTMGNLVSILVHCQRGTEIILGDKSHTFLFESGGISAFGGIHSRQLKNNDNGTINIDTIKNAIRSDNIHFPKSSAISIENTHNICNGSPLDLEYINLVSKLAKNVGMKFHIDGARIFNASVALSIDIKKLVAPADSITFCLSKGLSSPIGSIICGNEEFIYYARRIRKALGGGMRQAGVLAASGIISLDTMITQIEHDHQNAQLLAEGIEKINGFEIDRQNINTNIIYFDIKSDENRNTKISSKDENTELYPMEIVIDNIHFFETSHNRFRLVTHYGISREDIDLTLGSLAKMICQ